MSGTSRKPLRTAPACGSDLVLSLVHVIEWRAATQPDAVALSDDRGGELTYASVRGGDGARCRRVRRGWHPPR